jgi:hypothetical protein
MTTTGSADEAGRVVVVPERPGPLRTLAAPSEWDVELDTMLDEVFGAPVEEGPGLTDAVLVLVGLAALAAWQLTSRPAWVGVLGAVCLVLGLVLPVRSTFLAVRRRRLARAVSAAIGNGAPLRLDDRSTRRLVHAYDAVLEESAYDAVAAPEAVSIAHQALIEVASLLEGRVPATASERAYVDERAAALDALHRELVAARPIAISDEVDGDIPVEALRDAAVDAMRDLESRTDGGSVARITALRDIIRRTPS